MFTDSEISVKEGSIVCVCVNLTTDGMDGLERDVLVDLTTAPGTAGTCGKVIW